MGELSIQIADAPLGKTHLIFLGQAGFVLKSKSGKLIAIDLYLSDCVARYDGFKRLMPFILRPDEIVFDYIITTHAHYDHFDPDSIPTLIADEKTKLFASAGCEKEVERLGISSSNISYVKVGDCIDLGDIKIEFVFCDHGDSAPDAFGVVIEIDGKLAYIAGDTCLRPDKVDEIKCGLDFDIMIAPTNGTFGNMNEAESAELCRGIKPKLMIPCHFGCFAEQWGNPLKFIEVMEAELPDQKYNLMRIGEQIEI
jgi:L-ascorbate 6-phosphate lactonase